LAASGKLTDSATAEVIGTRSDSHRYDGEVKQHTKDVYVIPAVIGVVLLLAGLPLSAWYTNQPVRTIVTWAGIKDILLARVSAWTDIILLLALVAVGYFLYRVYRRYTEAQRESDARHAVNLTLVEHMQQKEKEHKVALRAIQNDGPTLHVAWNKRQSIWGLGAVGTEPCMQIGGWAHISTSNISEEILITDAYIEGTESRGMMPIKVHPRFVRYTQLMAFVAPVVAKAGEPFKGKFILVDHKNRKYSLEEHTFRFIGSQQQITTALQAGKDEAPPSVGDSSAVTDEELIIKAPDDLTMRIRHYQFQETRGLTLIVDNNRLNAVHQIRVIVADAQSFDLRHDAYRQGSNFAAAVVTKPNAIQPSCSSSPILIVRKEPSNKSLLAGDDFSHAMVWPENDTSEIERWRFTLRVIATTLPRNASEKALPLKELFANIVLFWDKANNEFAIEQDGD
jgi:hypothetical protein